MNSPIHPASLSEEIHHAYQKSKLTIAITLLLIAILAVVLRFVAKVRRSAKTALEDWFIVLALFFYVVFTALYLKGTISGDFGYNLTVATLPTSLRKRLIEVGTKMPLP